MNFKSIDDIHAGGFDGFVEISDLQKSNCSEVPDERGVYLVLRPNRTGPKFLERSTGGRFKGKDPKVEASKLEGNWVEGTVVLYIGVGGLRAATTLRSRLRLYMQFGRGMPAAHKGGRFIWQLHNSSELLLCWKVTPRGDPGKEESRLMQEFEAVYGKLPFANLRR